MGWKFWKRKGKGEKEYLKRLGRKVREGINPSYKEPSAMITFTDTKTACPKCGSKESRSAGYGNRLECKNCGKIFT